ncbi:MAG: DivIVA domain-containing protein [Bdellovibrionaceae bacterium]|nr:DivIVA domain-containing protein [Pseudobdellovibrionaceae bacterium]
MKFNNIEVTEKTFRKKMRGLDTEQVFDFLRRISIELETANQERSEARRRVKEVEVQLQEYKDRDELLKNTIANATKMADRIRVDSEREAKLIIEDSKQKADMIIREAKDSLKQIYQDVSDLKRVRIQFENNLRALMQSHIAMLEQGKKMMPDPEIEPSSMRPQVNNQSLAGSSAMNKTADDLIQEKLHQAQPKFNL